MCSPPHISSYVLPAAERVKKIWQLHGNRPASEGKNRLPAAIRRRFSCPGLSGIERDYSPSLSLSLARCKHINPSSPRGILSPHAHPSSRISTEAETSRRWQRKGVRESLQLSRAETVTKNWANAYRLGLGERSAESRGSEVGGVQLAMRQAAAEAQVLTPHFELGEQGLRQVLSDVIEEVRRSIGQDIDGADVYECLQRYRRNPPPPALDYASGLSLQLLIDIRSSPCCSEEARELYHLLRQPHLQALLSAHDTVAQKDYEPVLPPMPEELPDDEEATRIVCLVKNKQPLPRTDSVVRPLRDGRRAGLPGVPPPRANSSVVAGRNPWVGSPAVDWAGGGVRRASCPYPPPTGPCRVCLWEQRLNHSAPSVYGSVPTGPPQKRRSQSPRVRTAPPSPVFLQCRRPEEAPAGRGGLDELRESMQLAANSAESSGKDVKLAGEKVAAAVEHMTESVRDNSQALELLTRAVDRLQALLSNSGTQTGPQTAAEAKHGSSGRSSGRSSSRSGGSSPIAKAKGFLSRSCHGSPRAASKTPEPFSEPCGIPLPNGLFDEPGKTPHWGCWTKKRKKET
ncbi:unnamed protein product [Menidia menidia]|uniref:(Atlantic silverside) hypothetical protein n=1 Tax=Menidia menidia TaxID=238744 RepID=A0A8S4BF21_9TELE|nr:unnamed protein product [Menidia menidia]